MKKKNNLPGKRIRLKPGETFIMIDGTVVSNPTKFTITVAVKTDTKTSTEEQKDEQSKSN